jgi:Uma2 family endonuclease
MVVVRGPEKFKAADIWATPDDGKRYEVIDGDLYVTPSPAWGHQLVVTNLLVVLANHIKRHGLGKIVPAPTGVVLDEETAVEPDIVFISREREQIISARGVEGPPDLVVEVLSPSTQSTDRTVKMHRYAAAGIPHYWLASTSAPAIEVYRLGEDGYELVGIFGPGTTFRPELFPDLEILIDDLFAP